MAINRKDVQKWTEWLVQIPSVVNTKGEADVARQLYEELKGWPYFQKHPEQIWLQPSGESSIERYNVVALVTATNQVSETTLLLGHIDTVGVDDYAQLKDVATEPAVLKERMKKQSHLPESVQQHLHDEGWMFGRGSCDMKSGVAANLAILRHFSESPEMMQGNLLLVAECDEEDSSNGILAAVPFLNQLAKERDLSITAAINTDFVTARSEGDPNRYIYLGTVGKLLPSFYVVGKETHVGQAFDGFDPNLLLSELTREIDYNPDLCDEMYGEVTPPPVSLKQTDLKPYYDVQTPLAGFAYYNFLVHSLSPKEVLDLLKERATTAFERAIQTYESRYKTYCERTNTNPKELNLQPRVYTYQEYMEYVIAKQGKEIIESAMQAKAKELLNSDLDIRYFCCRMVEELHRFDENREPVCILFYSSLYSPRVALSSQQPYEERLMKAVEEAVANVKDRCPQPIEVRQFFPYISDMSFVKLSDDEEGIHGYIDNMPAWGSKHTVPFDEIRQLNVPIVNIGPYGFDAHKKWERVELTYSLEVVPEIMLSVIHNLWSYKG
ncbi:M20/M25/M40 family metallo-hydrolase [Brevibacillus sp. SYSU BS000544]|uniref:M20/M25/M40 family metallo-hydrolase n=1 Tax=Brevibacillus sp. SYSU BS000544 TaxID=3416443 RepID=UPI003CE53FAA